MAIVGVIYSMIQHYASSNLIPEHNEVSLVLFMSYRVVQKATMFIRLIDLVSLFDLTFL